MNFMVDGQALGSISRGVRPPSREHATVTWLKDGWKMGRLRRNWFSWSIQEFKAKQGHIKIAEHVYMFAVIKDVFVCSIFGAYFHCEGLIQGVYNSLYTWFWHVPMCFICPFPWPFVVNGWSWPCSTPLFHRGLEGLLPVHVTLNREFPFKMVLKSRKGCVSLPKNWWTNMNKLFHLPSQDMWEISTNVTRARHHVTLRDSVISLRSWNLVEVPRWD